MKKWFGILIIIVVILFAIDRRKSQVTHNEPITFSKYPSDMKRNLKIPKVATVTSAEKIQIQSKSLFSPNNPIVSPQGSPLEPEENHLLHYELVNGLAMVQNDIILGEISSAQPIQNLSGQISEPLLQIWPSNEIPYHIQPTLPHPERVLEALQFFSNTNVRFISFTDQVDAIVFEAATGPCKSYLGRVGGHQPLFLSDGCQPPEIAHEIMHALGFLHEQNRSDRDDFISMQWPNIDPKYKINFEKFSSQLMRLSGQSEFDFQSIMIYPTTMFSTNGGATMQSKFENQSIIPSRSLSQKDIERINKVY